MGALEIICGFILLVVSGVVVVSVVFQESDKGGGLNALAGGEPSNSFYEQNKGKTKQGMLVRATTISGIVLVATVFVLLALGK